MNFEQEIKLRQQIRIANIGANINASKVVTLDDVLEKGKVVPVGTVSNGRKKVAEGKWIPVSQSKHVGRGKAGQNAVSKEAKDAKKAIAVFERTIDNYKNSIQGAKHFASEISTLKGKISEQKKKLKAAERSMPHVGLSKSIEILDDYLEKGKALPIGTERTHGGKKVVKTAKGWEPKKEGKSSAEKGVDWISPEVKEIADKLSRANKNDAVRAIVEAHTSDSVDKSIEKLRELGAKYSRANDNETARGIAEVGKILVEKKGKELTKKKFDAAEVGDKKLYDELDKQLSNIGTSKANDKSEGRVVNSMSDMGSPKLSHYLLDGKRAALNVTRDGIMHWVVDDKHVTYSLEEFKNKVVKQGRLKKVLIGDEKPKRSSISPSTQSKKDLYSAVNEKYGTSFKQGDIEEFEDDEFRTQLSEEDVINILEDEIESHDEPLYEKIREDIWDDFDDPEDEDEDKINRAADKIFREKYGRDPFELPEVDVNKTTLKKAIAILDDYLEKGGKRAVIGEIRKFGGRDYIKTAQGWKFHGKGTGTKAKAHKEASKSATSGEGKQSKPTSGQVDAAISRVGEALASKKGPDAIEVLRHQAKKIGMAYGMSTKAIDEAIVTSKKAHESSASNQTKKQLFEEYIKGERDAGNKITAKTKAEARSYAERNSKNNDGPDIPDVVGKITGTTKEQRGEGGKKESDKSTPSNDAVRRLEKLHQDNAKNKSAIKSGATVQLNDDVNLVSFMDIKGKSLKVDRIKSVEMASGPKQFAVISHNGKEYEVDVDFLRRQSSTDLMKPQKGKVYEVASRGKGEMKEFILEANDGSHMVDMTFSDEGEAKKFAEKRGFPMQKKESTNEKPKGSSEN